MNTEELFLRVGAYVGLRQALGYVVTSEEKLLKDFVRFVAEQGGTGPIRAQMALDWACTPSPRRGPAGQASRLKVVRRFLAHLRAAIPETEVPGPGMLAKIRRPKPYIYSRWEIERLLEAASHLRPKDSLRPHTYTTIIGLIASTGLRVGEAIRLTLNDLHLDADPPYLEVLQTKFRKSRLVPVHPSTADKLRLYLAARERLHYDGLTDAFFVSEQGTFLHYNAVWDTFAILTQIIGIRDDSHREERPCIHSLRHTFAVRRMLDWYRSGLKVKDLLPSLSVYMGHVQPAHTYWYLTATPELLAAAGERFRNFTHQEGGDL
jgi:integrase/recombinase XerD